MASSGEGGKVGPGGGMRRNKAEVSGEQLAKDRKQPALHEHLWSASPSQGAFNWPGLGMLTRDSLLGWQGVPGSPLTWYESAFEAD